MKHLHTFESFVDSINEGTEKGVYFRPESELIAGSPGTIHGIPAPMGRSPFGGGAGLYWNPFDKKIEGFYEGNGRIVYDLGDVQCDQDTWLKNAPKIAEELNAILQLNPDALKGFAGKKKPNAAPLKTLVDIIKKHCK